MTNLSDLFPQVPTYTPAMMEFDGSTGYYNISSITTAGNLVTEVFRIKLAAFSGGGTVTPTQVLISGGDQRLRTVIRASDHANTDEQNRILMLVQNTSSADVCRLISNVDIADGNVHTVFMAFDGDNGTAVFKIDGVDADDTGASNRVAPTTGTLDTGATTIISVGAEQTGSQFIDGDIGFFGYRDAYLTNWADFMDSSGNPRQLNQVGWTQWNGGTFQTPMMTFNGSTGYYSASPTLSGNKFSVLLRFAVLPEAGSSDFTLWNCIGTGGTRGSLGIGQTSHADGDYAEHIRLAVQNTSGTNICRIYSTPAVTDGLPHTLLASFDGDTGVATFILDGVDTINASATNHNAPTTGTVVNASITMQFGAGNAEKYTDGDIGYFGYRDAYLTNWQDFMESDGTPKEIDEIGWRQWGGQPLFWNKGGVMTDNRGSAGNMTENGTITGPIGGWPLFWNEHGQMSNNLGQAGDMTENGTIIVGKGGN